MSFKVISWNIFSTLEAFEKAITSLKTSFHGKWLDPPNGSWNLLNNYLNFSKHHLIREPN